ncbi:MarR family transcriptional regulator [Pelagibius sp. 7325]|uniref:MarR family winged helix-turn-helix transcriptional regulator n=1 Tax=Pelagibius sp. 7325 TaxID=3131994 RepID=UPI0030EE970A
MQTTKQNPARRGRLGTTAARSQDVLTALRRIIRATDLHSKQLARDVGLTTPQAVVLQAVRDLGEVTTGQLSRRVSLSQGTVTTILDRLEERGLVERYRSTADRRVVHGRLTRRGRNLLAKTPPLLHEKFTEAFSGLSAARQDRIITTLDEIAAMMGAADLDAAPLLDSGSSVKRAE